MPRSVLARDDGLRHDRERDAGELEVELEAGHACVGAAELEVHVAIMILAAEDVGEDEVTLKLPVFTVLGDKAGGNAGDRLA